MTWDDGLNNIKQNTNSYGTDDAFVTKIERVLNRDAMAMIDYLTAENKVLKRVIATLSEKKKRRVVFTEIERRTLVTYALRLGNRMRGVVTIVKPETILAWHRRMKKEKWNYSGRPRKKGRPAIADDTRELILRIARDNSWGYTRISGELSKIGHKTCPTTVRNVLLQEGIKPAPDRKGLTWKKFIESHMHNTWAADFFTEEVWTACGLVTFYVLFFIHLQTQRVYIAGCTPHPNAQWTAQQGRNFIMTLDDIPEVCNNLIHDRDQCFLPLDYVLKSEGIKIIKTPYQSPRCNAYAERFVRECRETLNNLIPLGHNSLLRHLKTIEHHHNFERPHQGIENRVPIDYKYPDKPAKLKEIRCRSSIGGLLNHYYVEKAA